MDLHRTVLGICAVFGVIVQTGAQTDVYLFPSVDQYLAVGDSFSVTCEVIDGTNPKWYDSNQNEILALSQPGFNTRRYVERSGTEIATLWFEGILDSDSGEYKCEVGSVSQTITITITEPIDFGTTPTTQHLIKDEDGFVACDVTSFPVPSLHWKFNDYRIYDDEHFEMQANGLKVNDVTIDDQGTYTCVARIKETGDVQPLNINVSVYELPQFLQVPESTGNVEGRSVAFYCRATGIPVPGLTWKFGDEEISSSEKYSITSTRNGTSILSINNLEVSDGGTYTCVASSPVSDREASANLLIHTVPEISSPTNRTVEEGDQVSFTCTLIKGSPEPTLRWQRNNEDLYYGTQPSDPRMEISAFGDSIVLTINNVNSRDIGAYTCIAQNFAGQDAKNFFINVEHAPYIDTARTPSVIYTWLGHPTEIKCVAVGNPAPKIQWEFTGGMLNATLDTQIGFNTYQSSLMVIMGNTDFGDYKCMAGNSRNSTHYIIIVEETYAPTAPSRVHVVTTTPVSVILTIEEPDSFGGWPIERCKVIIMRGTNGPKQQEKIVDGYKFGEEISVDGLEGENEYTVTSACANKVGFGAYSSPPVLFNTLAYSTPGAPTIFSKPVSKLPMAYILEWMIPDNGGLEIKSYEITYGDNSVDDTGMSKVISGIPPTQTEYTIRNLNPNTEYQIQLKALNDQGAGESSTITVKTAEGQDPANPGYGSGSESTAKFSFVLLSSCILSALLEICRT